MMEQCLKCAFYTKEWDQFRQMYDDVISDDDTEHHFCIMFDSHIPQDIVCGNKNCKYYTDK